MYKYDIKGEMASKMELGIKYELQRLQLYLKTNPSGFGFLVGERPIKKSSKETYWVKLRALRYFFALIGDYASILILLDNAPEPFCPSINPDSLILFIKWKRSSDTDFLQDKDGHQVYDIFGQPIKCDGSWKAPNNVESLSSALNALFTAKEIFGPLFIYY